MVPATFLIQVIDILNTDFHSKLVQFEIDVTHSSYMGPCALLHITKRNG